MTDDRRPTTVKTKRFFLSSVIGPRSTRYPRALANGSCRRPPIRPRRLHASSAKFSSGRMGARPPPPVGLPSPSRRHPTSLSEAAPAGPERHCREVRQAARVGPSLQASRGDPKRRLTAWVPPCSRSVQGNEHGSRLGFPGRRPPRGPAAPGNVARDLRRAA
jgi:hypothetical protein